MAILPHSNEQALQKKMEEKRAEAAEEQADNAGAGQKKDFEVDDAVLANYEQ